MHGRDDLGQARILKPLDFGSVRDILRVDVANKR